jgi:formylglycine-generating enzyme required for sulfatase activity
VKLEMIYLKGGEFMMGSNEFDWAKPPHRVKVSPFFIGRYPVTQAQWKAVMGDNPSRFQGDDLPVENVSWDDAVKFCEAVSKLTGETYRLPTEAEWEYACRARSTTKYSFGDDEKLLGEYAWYYENSGGKTHPVGQKKPNAWGLCDMPGNVWEWCQDDWHNSYNSAPVDGSAWVDVSRRASFRIVRGGGWYFRAVLCRSAYRGRYSPGHRDHNLGLRLVRVGR